MAATVEIPDELMERVRGYAARTGMPFEHVLTAAFDLLEAGGAAKDAKPQPPEPIDGDGAADESWPAFRKALYGE